MRSSTRKEEVMKDYLQKLPTYIDTVYMKPIHC